MYIYILSVDAVDFYMYIYTISTESKLHQSRRCVDRRTGGRNLCTGACNDGTSSDSADNAYNVLCLLTVSYYQFIYRYILLFSSAFSYMLFQQPLNTYDYRSVITFGGWKEDFMLVVSQLFESAPHHYEHRTEKLLFVMSKFKVSAAFKFIEIQILQFFEINVW